MEVDWLVFKRKFVVAKYLHLDENGKKVYRSYKTAELTEFLNTVAPTPIQLEHDQSIQPIIPILEKKYGGSHPEIKEAIERRRKKQKLLVD
jgi:hypothetical protein